MLICTGFSCSVHFISWRVEKQIVLFRPCALLDSIQLLGDLFMTHYLCCESLTAIHYAAVCFQLCFLNCISLCCYWDPCASPNWILRGSWVKSRLITHWTLVFFSSWCLFLIAVLLCSRSGTEARLVNHWQSGNILLVEVQSSFFCLFWHWHYSQTSWWPSFSEENSKFYFKILDLHFGSATCLSNSQPSPQVAFTFGAVCLLSFAFLQTSGIKLGQEKPKAYEPYVPFASSSVESLSVEVAPDLSTVFPQLTASARWVFLGPHLPLRHKELWKPQLQVSQPLL